MAIDLHDNGNKKWPDVILALMKIPTTSMAVAASQQFLRPYTSLIYIYVLKNVKNNVYTVYIASKCHSGGL